MIRFLFPPIVIFFVTMNYLLWRHEFSSTSRLGKTVPVEVVWQKMLTAPDDSSLDISKGRKKLGYLRWVANIDEPEATGKVSTDESQPEGMVKTLTGYKLDLDGTYLYAEPNQRIRFNLHLDFTTNRVWRKFEARIGLKPSFVEIKANAEARVVNLAFETDGERTEKILTFDDLREPGKILEEFGIPMIPGLIPFSLPTLGGTKSTNAPALNLGLEWQARNEWMPMGHSRVHVYRLETTFLQKYKIVIFTSRVGEILRVELPGDLILLNEALGGL